MAAIVTDATEDYLRYGCQFSMNTVGIMTLLVGVIPSPPALILIQIQQQKVVVGTGNAMSY